MSTSLFYRPRVVVQSNIPNIPILPLISQDGIVQSQISAIELFEILEESIESCTTDPTIKSCKILKCLFAQELLMSNSAAAYAVLSFKAWALSSGVVKKQVNKEFMTNDVLVHMFAIAFKFITLILYRTGYYFLAMKLQKSSSFSTHSPQDLCHVKFIDHIYSVFESLIEQKFVPVGLQKKVWLLARSISSMMTSSLSPNNWSKMISPHHRQYARHISGVEHAYKLNALAVEEFQN